MILTSYVFFLNIFIALSLILFIKIVKDFTTKKKYWNAKERLTKLLMKFKSIYLRLFIFNKTKLINYEKRTHFTKHRSAD